MKTSMKRFMSILVVTALLLTSLPMAFASGATSFTDFPTGWSAPAMEAAVANGLLTGFEDGTIRPGDPLTRAQVATIITRAFGAQTTADVSAFSDVPASAWFAPYIARAVKMGALNGTSATTMAPDVSITREQVFTAVARVLVLSSSDTSVLNKFNDAGSISSWAAPYMAALVQRGYINGDTYGNVNPQANITREEFAQFMYNAVRTYITKSGTYSANLEGITVIRVGGVTLNGLNATSDIVLGDGAGTGSVTMSNVTIEGRLLARGGTITLSGVKTGAGVVVNNMNGITMFLNYRNDPVFVGIVENTVAQFLSFSPSFDGSGGSGGGGGGGTTTTDGYTVSFYESYGTTNKLADVTLAEGVTRVPATSIPAIGRQVAGYEKNSTVAGVYSGNYTHFIQPSYWYEVNNNGTTELVPFDATVEVQGDMNVYLLYQRLGIFLNYGDLDVAVTAAYKENTRAVDSVKDLAVSAGNQLETAIATGQIDPDSALASRLVNAGLIDADKNIQITELPISIFDVFNETTAPDIFDGHVGQGYYDIYMDSMRYDEEFEINSANLAMIRDVSAGIRGLDYEEVLEDTHNELLEELDGIFGRDYMESHFDDMVSRYCEGLNEAIGRVYETGTAENYSTSGTMRVSLVELFEILSERAENGLKTSLAGVDYENNIYLKYLVEHDVIAALFNGDGTQAGNDTGYQLKSVMDYYNYLTGLLIVADDALCWYSVDGNGDGQLSQAEFDAICDAVFGKLTDANDKMNAILTAYESDANLGTTTQNLIDQIQELSALLTNYSTQIENLLNGQGAGMFDVDAPARNVNDLYDTFYQREGDAQAKVQELITSGELGDIIDLFEASPVGAPFVGGSYSLSDLFNDFATNGIAEFAVEENDVSVIDAYEVTVGDVTLTIKRYYQ